MGKKTYTRIYVYSVNAVIIFLLQRAIQRFQPDIKTTD